MFGVVALANGLVGAAFPSVTAGVTAHNPIPYMTTVSPTLAGLAEVTSEPSAWVMEPLPMPFCDCVRIPGEVSPLYMGTILELAPTWNLRKLPSMGTP